MTQCSFIRGAIVPGLTDEERTVVVTSWQKR
jgi:hypothetical protein